MFRLNLNDIFAIFRETSSWGPDERRANSGKIFYTFLYKFCFKYSMMKYIPPQSEHQC